MAKANSVGTTLSINSKTIGCLKSISGVEISAETIDVTSLATEGGYREFLGGFKDGGEVALEGFYDGTDEGQGELYTDIASGTSQTCVITFPTAIAKKWTFTGVVTKFATGFDVDGAVTFSASIKVSGAPVLAAVTPPSP